MKIFRSFKEISGTIKSLSPVVTWGVFDGVHRGHQSLIKGIVNWAKQINSHSLVITFQNHPERVIRGHNDPLFITSLSHRLLLLKQSGVDSCLVLNFTKRLSQLSPEGFINKIIRTIKPSGIVVTDNILFGKGRQGNIQTIRNILNRNQNQIRLKIIKPLKYRPEIIPTYRDTVGTSLRLSNKIISSSLIRKAIKDGRLKDAEKMLGRRVAILGTVVRGEGRGRLLGYPTANLDPHHEILPPRGVYIAKVTCFGKSAGAGKVFKALVNIGIKPTFHPESRFGGTDVGIEVYLVDYNKRYGTLYGTDILVEIMLWLRPEKRFATPDLLINQIKSDISVIN